jgi:hypothetical protein
MKMFNAFSYCLCHEENRTNDRIAKKKKKGDIDLSSDLIIDVHCSLFDNFAYLYTRFISLLLHRVNLNVNKH